MLTACRFIWFFSDTDSCDRCVIHRIYVAPEVVTESVPLKHNVCSLYHVLQTYVCVWNGDVVAFEYAVEFRQCFTNPKSIGFITRFYWIRIWFWSASVFSHTAKKKWITILYSLSFIIHLFYDGYLKKRVEHGTFLSLNIYMDDSTIMSQLCHNDISHGEAVNHWYWASQLIIVANLHPCRFDL